jgi:hypothetical protein
MSASSLGEAGEIGKRARSWEENDRRDAELILDLWLKDKSPQLSPARGAIWQIELGSRG